MEQQKCLEQHCQPASGQLSLGQPSLGQPQGHVCMRPVHLAVHWEARSEDHLSCELNIFPNLLLQQFGILRWPWIL